MALTKIKMANKKAQHERRRKQRRVEVKTELAIGKIRNKRMRRAFIEGRKEHNAMRQNQKAYIDELENEVGGEATDLD